MHTFPVWAWYVKDTSASLPPKFMFLLNILPLGIAVWQLRFHRSYGLDFLLSGGAISWCWDFVVIFEFKM